MADKSSDIQHLFEHLGLDPQDYREVRAKKEEQGEHVDRWSLLSEISSKSQKTAEIPEEKRQAAADLGASKRASRIAQIQADSGRAADDAATAKPAATMPAAEADTALEPPADTADSPVPETARSQKSEAVAKPSPKLETQGADQKVNGTGDVPEPEAPEERGSLGKNLRNILSPVSYTHLTLPTKRIV